MSDKELDLLDDIGAQPFDKRLLIVDKKLIWRDGDVSIICLLVDDEWSYYIAKGGSTITRSVRSKKPPYEVDARRDNGIKKELIRAQDRRVVIDVNVVMGLIGDFGLYLMNTPEVMDSYMGSVTDRVEPGPEVGDEALAAQAQEILKNGDPVKYIMDAFHSIHIGDDGYGRLLMLAIASQHVRNTHGIHLTPSGASGKGKSHAGRTMLHLVPKEYWLAASLSPKSLYYYATRPGTIIFSDDVVMSEELVSIIRRCITGFTESQEHITVTKDREGLRLLMPPRIIWIIASVENFLDSQTRNRMIDVPVDESPETDELVFQKQVKDGLTGAEEFPETYDVLVCREIFRIIKELEPISVIIPYATDIDWKIRSNRRNFDVFKDIITAHTLLRHLQRDKTEEGALIATTDDFYDAATLYLTKAEGEGTKLTKGELAIVNVLLEHGDCTVSMLQKILGKERTTIQKRLKGRDGKAGMLEKVPGLTVSSHSDAEGDDIVIHREWFHLDRFDRFAQYEKCVSLRNDDEVLVVAPIEGCERASDIHTIDMMRDAHIWWNTYAEEFGIDQYAPTDYLKYLIIKEPKYNTTERREALLWIITHKKDGKEGWC